MKYERVFMINERRNTALLSWGLGDRFCSIVTLPWRNRGGVGRLLTANRVIAELYWNLLELESSAITEALTTQVKATQPRAIPLHSLFSVSPDHLTELSWTSESNLVINTLAC